VLDRIRFKLDGVSPSPGASDSRVGGAKRNNGNAVGNAAAELAKRGTVELPDMLSSTELRSAAVCSVTVGRGAGNRNWALDWVVGGARSALACASAISAVELLSARRDESMQVFSMHCAYTMMSTARRGSARRCDIEQHAQRVGSRWRREGDRLGEGGSLARERTHATN
jgi:hypothetical protein